ncbi:hypothetical protein OG978_34025 [Streptomyces sp. NBC_01591]|uniref:hypothetical protein n=1 Tax=Streptomyces sp. NBC_01591 TaxID=2975888 RepID=UPI002DDB2CBB|nr:hypothetical protein [Streptomyces sp. NBC_01591]WSD71979.1 hypothetical protein OG978_34025 [Streptomyces sp. NBC_01591]
MRGVRALGALLPLVLLATGCGIRATDVVEVGDPATVEVAPGREQGTLLYFVSSSSASRLMPVVRPNEVPLEGSSSDSGTEVAWRGADRAVALLFEGPSKSEAATDLRTELPYLRVELTITVGPNGVWVRLNAPVTTLSEVARQQLICTAAQARTADRGEAVKVTGTDGVIGPAHCSV